MKLALDPHMIRHLPLPDVVRAVADLGYEHLELTPRPDFLPFYIHPRADDAVVSAFRAALAETGVSMVAASFGDYRWSSPDEALRTAAVRYWLAALDVLAEVGCTTVMTELGGDPRTPEACEAALWRSLEDLLPRHEQLGIGMNIQVHPFNFLVSNTAGVDLVRGIRHPLVGYCYVAAHTFHLGDDVVEMVRYAGPDLRHVLIADSGDHRASSGLRFLVNPHGSPVTVHQHLAIGRGDVDFRALFRALHEVGFDGILTSNVYGEEERAMEVYAADRAAVLGLMAEAAGGGGGGAHAGGGEGAGRDGGGA